MSEGDPLASSGPARSTRTIVLAILAAFVAGGLVTAAVYFWYDAARSTGSETQALRRAQTATAPLNGEDTALTVLEARETELTDRIAGLEVRLANVDTDSRVASSFASRAEGLLIAFAARRSLERGQPLGYIGSQLRARFQASEPVAVSILIQASNDPLTIEDLRLALDKLAPKLLTHSSVESWWTGFRRELGTLVVIREAGGPSPVPVERLARARRMLDAGQVEAALVEVERLPGAADAQAWLVAAKRYINTRRALNAVETAAIQGRAIAEPVVEPIPAPSAGPAPAVSEPQPAATPTPAAN